MQMQSDSHSQELADLQALYTHWREAQDAFNETGGIGNSKSMVDELKARKRLNDVSKLRGELNTALDNFLTLHPDFDVNALSNPEAVRCSPNEGISCPPSGEFL